MPDFMLGPSYFGSELYVKSDLGPNCLDRLLAVYKICTLQENR